MLGSQLWQLAKNLVGDKIITYGTPGSARIISGNSDHA